MTYSKKLADVLLRQKRILVVPDGTSATPAKKLIFLSGLASLGYEPIDTHKYADTVLDNHSKIINSLKKLKAGHVDYVPLFSGFPNKVPSELEHFSKRFYGLMGNVLGLFTNGQTLDSGVIIPEWLFDLNEFGVDPITQFQDLGLFLKGIDNQKAREEDTAKSLSKLRFVTEHEAWEIGQKYLNDILTAKSSIKETIREDIETLLDLYGADYIPGDQISFKETKAYVQKYFWSKGDYEAALNLASAPTDLLRLFAALTDSDISLSEKIKFPKFSRRQRRLIMATLDKFPGLATDMQTYRGLWIAIGRGLHFGEYIGKYKTAVAGFALISEKKLATWNNTIEMLMSAGSYDLEMLKQRPGEFARRLHAVLRRASAHGGEGEVLTAFEQVAERVPLKTLLVLERYFWTVDDCDYRTVINKKGKIKIFKNELPKLDRTGVAAGAIMADAIKKKIAQEKESWADKKVWVDPILKSFVVPLQQRKASDSFLTVGRGTRLKFDDSKVLRLFIWWKQKNTCTDLDLSLVQFDENMNFRGHVSYTRLSDSGIVHSGDITSAPYGASEFIDVKIDVLKKRGVRYVAPQIYRFAGDSFADMDECYAGWMCRKKVDKKYKSFDIKTVENAFNLNGRAAYSLPMIVDLHTNEIVFVDLYVGNRILYNRVENSLESVSAITREISRMAETKPNMLDLALFNVHGRGAILVQDRDEADLTIGVTDCDFNATEIESVLNEFLA